MKNDETGMKALRIRTSRALRVLVLAAAIAAPLAGCGKNADSGQAAPKPQNVTLTAEQRQRIGFTTVQISHYRNSIDATGVVDFDNDQATSVLAPMGGPVIRVLVQPGEKVRKGQPLATVASPDYASTVSTYAKALVTAQNARRIADADKDLVQHQSVSQRENEQAQTDAVSAEQDRDAAFQAVKSLDIDPATLRDIQAGKPAARVEGVIRAPLAGTVVERLITPGQLLQAATTPAFTVADLSRVWVMVQLFGTDTQAVKVGDRATISTGVSADLHGRVDNIAALVNPDTRGVLARVVVDNPGDLLKKQMYVQVSLESHDESSGTLVPVSAVLRDDENLPFVYVTQPDGSFARRQVTLGNRVGDRYAIPEGLKAGDQIVTNGGLFMQFLQTQ